MVFSHICKVTFRHHESNTTTATTTAYNNDNFNTFYQPKQVYEHFKLPFLLIITQ